MHTKKYFYLFVLAILLLTTSCAKSQDNQDLKDHFESSEIAELEKLVSSFDSIVQQKTTVKGLDAS